VIPQMVIDIRDAHEKHDAPPELLEIARGSRTIASNEFRQFDVARALCRVVAISVLWVAALLCVAFVLVFR